MKTDDGLLRGERGSAMVELAICAPVLCLLFVGSIEFHKLTNYKRKVIGATRYACWEVVARKGEPNLERKVAQEMHDLWFPEIPFDANSAVVGSFTNDNSQGSRVQLKVEKMSSSPDLTNSGFKVWGTLVGKVAAEGYDLKLGSITLSRVGYHLVDTNPDDRIKTTVRMTYQPTFFPIVMNFLTLKESKVQDQSKRPKSWNVEKNLMSVGGDVPFARMVLCNGTWDEYRRDEIIKRVEGMWWPNIFPGFAAAFDAIESVSFGFISFDCHVETDLVAPYNYNPGDYLNATNWWQTCESPKKTCRCVHDEDDRFEDGGTAEDPTQGMQAEQEEYEQTKAELEQRIQDDQERLDEIAEERQERLNDDDPDNDDVSDLDEEEEAVREDMEQAQSDLDTINGL